MTRRTAGLRDAPVAVATLQSDIPDGMTLADYRRALRPGEGRRRRRRWRRGR